MTFAYSSRYEPPAPALPTLISAPAGNTASPTVEVVALCDTGADTTCLPTDLVADLGLVEVDEVRVQPYEGEPVTEPLYAALLRVGDSYSQITRVISVDSSDIILGRDLLNSMRLDLDGPSQLLRVL